MTSNNRKRLRTCIALFATFGLALCRGDANAVDEPTQTLASDAELAAITKSHQEQESTIHSLYVAYRVYSELVGSAADVRKFLCTMYLEDENHEFALKGNMRIARSTRAQEYNDIFDKLPDGSPKKVRTDPGGVCAFDGKATYILDSVPGWRKHPPALISIPERETIGGNAFFNQDYINSCLRARPDPFNIEKGFETKSLAHLCEQATCHVRAQRESVDGASCIVIDWNENGAWTGCDGAIRNHLMGHAIWCDPELKHAVRRHDLTYFNDDNLIAERRNFSQFVEVAMGVWLPKSWTWERFAPPVSPSELHGSVLLRYHYSVSDIHANDVADSIFTPVVPPGTMVSDSRYNGKTIQYTMPANERELQAVVQGLLKGNESVPRSQPLWRKYVSGGIIFVNCLFIAVVAYSFRKRLTSLFNG